MKRIVVLGGSGFFGSLIIERLRAMGLQPFSASRTRGDLQIDANNPDSLRANLKQRDLVIDAAGPFQKRTPALIELASRVGFDIIDLSDSAEYTAMVYEREAPIGAAGIRVLTACSSLSTVSALVVQASGIEQPRKLSTYLLPASRYTANPGAVESFFAGLEGKRRTVFFGRLGARSGVTVKSVDAVTLPRAFPSLTNIDFVVDSGSGIGNFALQFPAIRRWIRQHQQRILKLSKRLGRKSGILAYDVASTHRHKQHVFTGEKTYILAVLPAVLAATMISAGRYPHRGLVSPANHVDGEEFFAAVKSEGISISQY